MFTKIALKIALERRGSSSAIKKRAAKTSKANPQKPQMRDIVLKRALREKDSSSTIKKRAAKTSKANPQKPQMRDIVLKRALRMKDSSSTIKKKPWESKMEKVIEELKKKRDKERAEREYFVCRFCLNTIARGRDLLSRVMCQPNYGLFRKVFNVTLVDDPLEYPGFCNYFRFLFCQRCHLTHLGSQIVYTSMPPTLEHGLYGEHWVPGNYFMRICMLRIRKGHVLRNSITGVVVGYV